MDDRHYEVLAVAALFFVVTWVTVGLRCYVRGIMMKTWGADDYFMVAALVGLATCMEPCKTLISHDRPLLPSTWPSRLSPRFTAQEDIEAIFQKRMQELR
jgi:hypothetical protein